MTIPVWTLLAFATWTLVLLLTTVGVYRWSRILTGRTAIAEFRADQVEGSDWYRRAMRAHANCVENLPVFGVIVFALVVAGVRDPTVDYLCAAILLARVAQSVTHVGFSQTNAVTSVRFAFFFLQIICMLWLVVIVVGDRL
jgi:uncharacterized MAPEG superfamily protein